MRVKFRGAAIAVALAVVLAGCGGVADNKTKPGDKSVSDSAPVVKDYDPDGVFSWGYTIMATSLDPHRGTSGFDQNWLFPVYDRLVYSTPDGSLEPMLATSWKVGKDGKSLAFELRTGVTFSDGTPFNAAAVKFSLDRAKGPDSTIKNELHNVTDVVVDGPSTVTLKLDGGAGALLGSLADRAGMIVSPTAAQAGTLASNPVGVGAYKVAEYKPGDRVVYERTDGYWDPDAQKVKKMVFRVMVDDQTRLNALKTDELTMALLRQNQVDPALDAGLKVLSGQSPTFYYFGLNTSKAPFDNPKVRLALNLAIDREGIGDGLLEGFCTPQLQPWPTTSFAYSEDIGSGLKKVPHDPKKAKELLKEAGVGEGLEFDASVTNITGYTAVAEAVQAQLKDVGVTMNLKVVPSVQAAEEFNLDKTVAATISGYSPSPDPQGVMDRLLLPTAVANPGGYSDPKVVELSEKAASSIDTKERAGYYADIMAELMDTMPSATPICMQQRTEAYTSNVSGLSIFASGGRDYRGVAVSKTK
ncbi:peptide/nickel transport system substrate-binding protein [Antricoccus suffuscus]|uniref:Peptide/nickel transport system substrate-binding protein n=1 Tax=Antricoccus suffuscus TaxID=1629062 RepID=A0A2T1A685_9ACTN|nr:ABC transporter substrate-binding protein [Antricoccus suffuscus]PRZ44123.1 peptide/nickel transport system substrate-binding protein [Antricoccus suffuscus]